MNDQDAITQGMSEAAARHGMHPVEAEYRAIQARPVGTVVPYVAPDPEPAKDTGALKPSQIRGLKVFGIASTSVGFAAGLFSVIASGALNTVFAWVIGGGAILVLASGLLGGVRSAVSKNVSKGAGGDTYIQNFNINNGGQQTNGKQ